MVKVFIFFPTAGQPQSAAHTLILSDSNTVKLSIGKKDKRVWKFIQILLQFICVGQTVG